MTAIQRAIESCETTGYKSEYHFRNVTKLITHGKGGQREIDDFMLTRYACYLIAQNGDPRKEPIAFAQSYFAIQTRKQELVEERLKLMGRLESPGQAQGFRKGAVGQHDRERNEVRDQKVIDTTVKRHFYSVESDDGTRDTWVESELAKIDGLIPKLVDELRSNRVLDGSRRFDLAFIAAVMMNRTPDFHD